MPGRGFKLGVAHRLALAFEQLLDGTALSRRIRIEHMPYLGPLAQAVWKLLSTLAIIVASTTGFGTYLLFKLNR